MTPPTPSSNTPETDAAAIGFARLLVDKEKFSMTELIDANFARSLERRLIAAVKELAQLKEAKGHDKVGLHRQGKP